MKKIFLLLLSLFLFSCTPRYNSICWHKAIYSSMVVASQTNQDVRIAVGRLGNELHAQAVVKDNGEWHYLCMDGTEVSYCTIYPFKIERMYTINEFLNTHSHYWEKGAMRGIK